MPNLYCTLADTDFASYDSIQEIIAACQYASVKEKEGPAHIIIHISFFTVADRAVFEQKIAARLPVLAWRDKL